MNFKKEVRTRFFKIVEKIKREYQPEKIILFGSYASGVPDKDSDIDLLIVTDKSVNLNKIYDMRKEFLRDFSIPVQLICVGKDEFMETKDIIGGITYPASKYGEILYEEP